MPGLAGPNILRTLLTKAINDPENEGILQKIAGATGTVAGRSVSDVRDLGGKLKAGVGEAVDEARTAGQEALSKLVTSFQEEQGVSPEQVETVNQTQRIKQKVEGKIADAVGEQGAEAIRGGQPINAVIASLNKMLPQGQQAVPGPVGGTIVGNVDQGGTTPALPVISPDEEAKQIVAALTQSATGAPVEEGVPEPAKSVSEKGDDNLTKALDILGTFIPAINRVRLQTEELKQERQKTAGLTKEEEARIQLEGQEARGLETAKQDVEVKEAEQKRMNEFFDPILRPEAMTSEASKTLSQIESALTGIDNINKLLDISVDNGKVSIGNKKLLTSKNFVNKNRQALIRARDVFINKALRRDTGAAIGKEEEAQFRRTFGFDVGVGSFLKNPEVIAQSLVESQEQLIRDRNRFLPNEQRNREVKSLLKQGFTKKQIFEELEKRGEI